MPAGLNAIEAEMNNSGQNNRKTKVFFAEMKLAVIASGMAMLFCHGYTNACPIQNVQQTHIGTHEGIKGECSNNGLRISCVFIEADGISCDGPGGSFSGNDLDDLIFSACGCSHQKEEEKRQKQELQNYG